MNFGKRLLDEQIDVYLAWGKKTGTVSSSYREYLNHFKKFIKKDDVLDISDEDVDFFLEKEYSKENSQYARDTIKRVIYCFRKFYMARSKNGKAKLGRGRPPAIAHYERVGELKTILGDKITFSEIGAILNPEKPVDKSLVWHWYQKYRKGGYRI